MPGKPKPFANDSVPIGSSVRLVTIRSFAREVGTSMACAKRILKALRVPYVQFDRVGEEYFNLPSLEIVLFQMLRPGGRSWTSGDLPAAVVGALDDPKLRQQMQVVGSQWDMVDRHLLTERCRTLGAALKKASKALADDPRLP